MTASELRVTYRTDEDWTGQIIATVKSGEFSARGAAWFDRINVKKPSGCSQIFSTDGTHSSADRRWLLEQGAPGKSRTMPPQDRC